MANTQNNRGNTNTDRDSEGRFASNSDSNRSSKNSQSNTGGTSNRGFAGMDKDKQRDIARKGGEASHGGQGRSSASSWDDE